VNLTTGSFLYELGELDPENNGSATDTIRYKWWTYVGTSIPYTTTTRDDLDWHPFEAVSDGTNVYFLPGFDGGDYNDKVCASYDPTTWTQRWSTTVAAGAGSVARSNGVIHNSSLRFWMDGNWYQMTTSDGTVGATVAQANEVYSNGVTDDLMVANNHMVWHDRTSAETVLNDTTTLFHQR